VRGGGLQNLVSLFRPANGWVPEIGVCGAMGIKSEMRNLVGFASVSIVASLLGFAAQAQNCEVTYELQPDDSLTEIATVAYDGVTGQSGNGALRSIYSQLLFSRNSEVIFDFLYLPTYSTMIIPCIDGSGLPAPDRFALANHQKRFDETEVQAGSEAVIAALREDDAAAIGQATEEVEAIAVAAFDPANVTKIRFLAASGQPPFVDLSLPNGGMVMELVEKSMDRYATNPAYSVVSIGDQTLHLQDLLIDGSFDIGFPWYRPQCEADQDKIRLISSKDVWMCKNFEFSGPFFETIQAFYVRRGEFPADATFKDMAGKTICRPHGTFMTDLIASGLEIAHMQFSRPETLEDCFAMLLAGDVDAVSTDALKTESHIVSARIGSVLQELPQLSTVWSVHAVAPKTKPRAVAALSIVDKGLYDLKIKGEWFRVVAPYLNLN
jgi:hypothetical protein